MQKKFFLKKATGQEEEVQENLDVTLPNGQNRRPAQWLSPGDRWPPTTCPKLFTRLAGCSDLCQDPRVPQGPVVPRRRNAPQVGGSPMEERVRTALWCAQGILVIISNHP